MFSSSCAQVLRQLIDLGESSRAELSQRTGLSRPTVSAVVDRLLRKGVLEELGQATSARGRRPIRIRLNPRYGYVLGFDVGGTNLRAGIKDFSGRLLLQDSVPHSPQPVSGIHVLRNMERLARELIDRARLPTDRLLAIGFGCPGIVDPVSRRTAGTTNIPGWDDLDVVNRLAQTFHVPVVADNDVNMAARAERDLGWGRQYPTFVFVAIGTGIGAGIVLNGELYRGHKGAAGEIAVMVLERHGLRPEYRAKGYLETVVAGPGIAKAAAEMLHAWSVADSVLPPDAAGVFAAAARGESWAEEIIERVVTTTGMAVANIVAVLAPQAVVLGGGVAAGNECLRAGVEAIVAQTVLQPVPVLFSTLGKDAGLLGALQAALDRTYRDLVG